jgi:hypothetical protein
VSKTTATTIRKSYSLSSMVSSNVADQNNSALATTAQVEEVPAECGG